MIAIGYLLARAELLRLFVSEFQITSRGSIAVEIGCQSRKKVAEALADRSNPGDMVARPGIVGMEIIHNCRVLQPVRRLHQQRSAIGTCVLEIGRASCRERGGKSVEISGVAG